MTTEDNPKNTLIAQRSAIKDRWLPWICARIIDDNLQYQILQAGSWTSCTIDHIKSRNTLTKLTLILPVEVCAYQIRSFPQHMINAKELQEAIDLDYSTWSPWGKQSGYCYSYQAVGDNWEAAVWVWNAQYAETLKQQLPFCTHIIPELAWYAGSVPPLPALLIVADAQSKLNYILLGEAGKIQAIARLSNQQAALRCWHGWGAPNISQVWEINQPSDFWLPADTKLQTLPASKSVPNANLLTITRLQGVRDWVDPSSYQKHIKYLLFIIFIAIGVDAGVLNYQTDQIQQQLTTAKSSANNVLAIQEHVEKSRQLTQHFPQLQEQQQIPEKILANLSTQIPGDIYINIFQLEGDQLDLNGQGKQVTRLLVLLEKLPGVERVMLLNDITRNMQTDEELFQLRLILKSL